MRKRPSYSKEFMERAVQMTVDSDLTLAEVAAELGISPGTLVRWREKLGVSAPRGGEAQALRTLRIENEELKKRNRQLEKEKKLAEMEREILKRAAAFFAKEQA